MSTCCVMLFCPLNAHIKEKQQNVILFCTYFYLGVAWTKVHEYGNPLVPWYIKVSWAYHLVPLWCRYNTLIHTVPAAVGQTDTKTEKLTQKHLTSWQLMRQWIQKLGSGVKWINSQCQASYHPAINQVALWHLFMNDTWEWLMFVWQPSLYVLLKILVMTTLWTRLDIFVVLIHLTYIVSNILTVLYKRPGTEQCSFIAFLNFKVEIYRTIAVNCILQIIKWTWTVLSAPL